jgi:hypothetical protein
MFMVEEWRMGKISILLTLLPGWLSKINLLHKMGVYTITEGMQIQNEHVGLKPINAIYLSWTCLRVKYFALDRECNSETAIPNY